METKGPNNPPEAAGANHPAIEAADREKDHRGVGEGDAGLPSPGPGPDPTIDTRLKPGEANHEAFFSNHTPKSPPRKLDAASTALRNREELAGDWKIPDDNPAFAAGREFEAKARDAETIPSKPASIEPKGVALMTEADALDHFKKLDGFLALSGTSHRTSDDLDDLAFLYFFETLTKRIHGDACARGWWNDDDRAFAEVAIGMLEKAATDDPYPLSTKWVDAIDALGVVATTRAEQPVRNDFEALFLMITEIAEAGEARREALDHPDDKIPEFLGIEAELADAIIRIMDFAGGRDLRVGEALIAKLKFNRTREHRHGGKLA